MKHAYLIMAHNEPEILQRLIHLLDCPENDIFVHIDKKSDIRQFALNQDTCHHSKLHILQDRISVNWGAFSIVECEMALMQTAHAQSDYDYYHIMSGVTLPIKHMHYIHEFFQNHQGTIFLGIDIGEIEEEAKRRIIYRNFFNDNQFRFLGNHTRQQLNGLSFRIQKLLHLEKNSTRELKIGAQWCSLTDAAVELLLSSKDWIRKTFQYGSCVDEIYKQTVIWNSPLRDKIYKIGNSLEGCMYEIDWNRGNGSSPYTYSTESDIELLIKSDKLFARKFSSQHMNVVKRLIESIHREKMIATEA